MGKSNNSLLCVSTSSANSKTRKEVTWKHRMGAMWKQVRINILEPIKWDNWTGSFHLEFSIIIVIFVMSVLVFWATYKHSCYDPFVLSELRFWPKPLQGDWTEKQSQILHHHGYSI